LTTAASEPFEPHLFAPGNRERVVSLDGSGDQQR
jgi:hypothetical protein